MWSCILCEVSFTAESVERHVYVNHLKPNSGKIKAYDCGECIYTAEGFEEIAVHCITRRHRPTMVIEGVSYDSYPSKLFAALEDTMCLTDTTTIANPIISPSSKAARTMILSGNETSSIMETIADDIDKVDWSQNSVCENTDGFRMKESMQYLNDGDDSGDRCFAEKNLSFSDGKTMENEKKGSKPTDNKKEEALKNKTSTIVDSDSAADNRSSSSVDNMAESSAVNELENVLSLTMKMQSLSKTKLFKIQDVIHGKMRHRCPVCGKRFAGTWKLSRHQRTHSGERPYPCATCGKAFGDAYSVKVHQRVHTGERPYTCSTCGKSFSDPATHRKHLRLHV